ncbi:MAG: hypothetical protein DRI40_04605, partial [Chloroflexi bacterium]
MLTLAALLIWPPTLSAATVVSQDGWGWENPLPQGHDLYAVWCNSSSAAYAVGHHGTILYSNGSSWTSMTSGTAQALYGVWGSSPDNVFAVGTGGTVLRFEGDTWSQMSSGTASALYGVWGSGADHVFAVGDSGTILHFDGDSWSDLTNATVTTKKLRGIWGSGPDDVFAVGDSGTIVHYNGDHWASMSSGTSEDLYAVWGSADNDVFALGDSAVMRHFDGSSWTSMNCGLGRDGYAIWGSGPADVYVTGKDGRIAHYDGTLWSPMDSGTNRGLRGIYGSGPSDVLAVGEYGTILHCDGSSWSPVSSGVIKDLEAAWGSGPSDVFVVGDDGTILHRGGDAWTSMDANTTADLAGVWGSSSANVYAVGESGTVVHYDGGAWTVLANVTTNGLRGVWGSSASNIYAVGDSGTILHYDGDSWASASSPTTKDLNAVWGSSASDVYAAGADGTMLHYDGDAWVSIGSPTTKNLNAVWGSSPTDVFVVGDWGTVLHYNGVSWSQLSTDTIDRLSAVFGSSATDVFAAGDWGTLLHYDGTSWSPTSSGTRRSFSGLWGTSAFDYFVVGAYGTILHYPEPAAPCIDGVTPSQGMQGATLDVAIKGANFSGASSVDFGPGITVNLPFSIDSPSQITASISIQGDAPLGPRDVTVTTSEGTATLVDGFTVNNRPPDRPSNLSPVDGATGQSLTPTLQSSAFSDPDAGDTHTASQWQITTTLGDYESPALVYDSGSDSSNKTEIVVPAGELDGNTTCYWRVRHQDSRGDWSEWSAETSFTTVNRQPSTPTNVSPSDGATGISLTPTLQSSDFSDPDGDGGHDASQWQVRESSAPADYSVTVFDSQTSSPSLTQVTLPSDTLDGHTTYCWRVRHQDNHGAWPGWSTETSFTTENRAPDQPVNTSPTDGATGVSLTPTLVSSEFSDPDGDAHAASQWQVRTNWGSYSRPLFDSETDDTNLTQITLPSDIINANRSYYWHVRHQDDQGGWSDWSAETSFTTLNRPPDQPLNTSPADEEAGVSLTPALKSSVFSDPDAGDTHSASQWQVRTADGSYDDPLFDSGESASLVQITLPGGTLCYNSTYYWRVRHKDSHEGWSDWSAETSFTTLNRAPNAPENTSPADEAVEVGLTPTLRSSDFSDPDEGDTHMASRWQVSTISGHYSGSWLVYDSDADASDLTETTLPAGTLDGNTTYYWRVKHQDNHGAWSGWSAETSFTTQNRPPEAPSNVLPAEGSTSVSIMPILESSAFSDPDGDGSHSASEWQVSAFSGDYSSPVFDSGPDASNLTQIVVPAGELDGNTTYYWHVKHQDNHGDWSEWSAETSFTTENRPPDQPANTSPDDGATLDELSPTLECSDFSDPDGDGSHVASQWQVRTASGDYLNPVFDSNTDASNLTAITVPSEPCHPLCHNTTYYWRVRHQDNHGAWSDWSEETSFTTPNRPPDKPVNLSPEDKSTGESVEPTLECSDFRDPDQAVGDTHAASWWQITT